MKALRQLCCIATVSLLSCRIFFVNGAFVSSSFPSVGSPSALNRKSFNRPPIGFVSKMFSGSNDDSGVSESKEVGESVGTWNPLRLAVLKLGFTELRFTSPLNYEKRDGSYICANCGSKLFDSNGKYDSGSGWPSFWKTTSNNAVGLEREWDGRIECTCQNCGGHLGHVFPDGPRRAEVSQMELDNVPNSDPKTSNPDNSATRLPRFCINGASLRFIPTE